MQKAATLSTIGVKAATVALNMAISMGIGVAINFAISALDDYIHRHERLIEAAEKEQKNQLPARKIPPVRKNQIRKKQKIKIQKHSKNPFRKTVLQGL